MSPLAAPIAVPVASPSTRQRLDRRQRWFAHHRLCGLPASSDSGLRRLRGLLHRRTPARGCGGGRRRRGPGRSPAWSRPAWFPECATRDRWAERALPDGLGPGPGCPTSRRATMECGWIGPNGHAGARTGGGRRRARRRVGRSRPTGGAGRRGCGPGRGLRRDPPDPGRAKATAGWPPTCSSPIAIPNARPTRPASSLAPGPWWSEPWPTAPGTPRRSRPTRAPPGGTMNRRARRAGWPGTRARTTTGGSAMRWACWPPTSRASDGGPRWCATTTRWSTGPRPSAPAWAGTARTRCSSWTGRGRGPCSARWSPTPRSGPARPAHGPTGPGAGAAPGAGRPARPVRSPSRGWSMPGAAWPGSCKRPAPSPRSSGARWAIACTGATSASRSALSTGWPIVSRHPSPDWAAGTGGPVDLLALLAAPDDELMASHGRWYIARRDPRYLRRNALVVLGNVGDGRGPADRGDAAVLAGIRRPDARRARPVGGRRPRPCRSGARAG